MPMMCICKAMTTVLFTVVIAGVQLYLCVLFSGIHVIDSNHTLT